MAKELYLVTCSFSIGLGVVLYILLCMYVCMKFVCNVSECVLFVLDASSGWKAFGKVLKLQPIAPAPFCSPYLDRRHSYSMGRITTPTTITINGSIASSAGTCTLSLKIVLQQNR